MEWKKRWAAVGVIVLLLMIFIFAGRNGLAAQEDVKAVLKDPKETLRIWYADEALTDYINSAAISYGEAHDIRVIPELQTGLEYLEKINKASLDKEGMPDLYIASNDSLGKAYLAGLASPIRDTEAICNSQHYPEPALRAVTYQDKMVGYPFYYETSVLLYNKTYLSDIAQNATEAEANIIPKTIDDILNFADEYDAPEAVEAVFKWDVSDIFYNYWFVGNYMIVGGEAGDDLQNIDIYNKETMDCLRVYQDLNQFFSIDAKEVSYNSVLQEFMEGKIVFSVVTTDAIAKIEAAKEEGTFQYEYGIAALPDLNENLKTKGLSVTSAVVVNGYSEKQEWADSFAKYLAYDSVQELYTQAGKVASVKQVTYENPNAAAVMEEYHKSIPMPKMLETSNFWVQLEIAFTKIWTGESVNEQLRLLSEQIMTQVTGSAYTEVPIAEPETETETQTETQTPES